MGPGVGPDDDRGLQVNATRTRHLVRNWEN